MNFKEWMVLLAKVMGSLSTGSPVGHPFWFTYCGATRAPAPNENAVWLIQTIVHIFINYPFSWFCLCRMQAYTYNSPLLLLAYTNVYRSLKIVKQGQNCTHNVGNPHYGRLNVQSGHTKLFIHWRKQPNTCVESECRVLWTFHTCIFLIQINREVCSEQRQPWKEGCSSTVSQTLRPMIGYNIMKL